APHVRRGLEGSPRRPPRRGHAYGYAAVPDKPGELVIDEAEAAIVRRTFAEFSAGRIPRAITAALNADRVAPPRRPMDINHQRQQRAWLRLLLNEIYAGQIVWNNVRMIKEPATGERVSRPNPPTAYRRSDAPQLRIFDAAPGDQGETHPRRRHWSRAPKPPVSGLLRCGSCGAA
ncbi:MAG: recombinase family protein, partial [Bradyrhizobium sp.]|nr:recombinase family protein [Bradyrhizobium sp.]